MIILNPYGTKWKSSYISFIAKFIFNRLIRRLSRTMPMKRCSVTVLSYNTKYESDITRYQTAFSWILHLWSWFLHFSLYKKSCFKCHSYQMVGQKNLRRCTGTYDKQIFINQINIYSDQFKLAPNKIYNTLKVFWTVYSSWGSRD